MLKHNIRKRKHWLHPFFRDSLNSGAYIVSIELKPGSKLLHPIRNSFSRQIYFVLPSIVCVAFAMYTGLMLN
jgi:hypothetical protein